MAVASSRTARTYQWTYLPVGWDTAWKEARSAVGSSPAYVAVIGDSNAQGFTTTDHMSKSFPALLRAALVAKYGLYGDYYPAAQSARYQTAYGGNAIAGTVPWTYPGDSSFSGSGAQYNGFLASMWQDTGTFPLAWVNAGSAMFTTPYACTDIDLIMHDWSASTTWKYNVDNAAGGSLVTNTNDGRNSIRRWPITGLSNATHVVRVGSGSTSLALMLQGAVTYNPTNNKTKGIGFANVSVNGMRLMDWAGSPNADPADRIQQWQGRYKTAASTEVLTGFGFPTQPHLAIVELGINDCQSSIGLVQFRASLRRLCDALRRGRDGCSIMFLICPNPAIATTDTTVQFTRAESWSLYAEQIYGVAAEYQCSVVNLHADWIPTSVTQGFTTSTDAHPTDVGHQAIADALTPLIV